MRQEYKAFHEAFDLLRKDFVKNKKYLNDKRITFSERQILKSYIAIRNNKYIEAFELLENCSPPNDYFNAHKFLILGIAHNNLSHFRMSKEYFEKCEKLFQPEHDSYFMFYLYLNWYYMASNTYDIETSKVLIEKVDRLEIFNKRFLALKTLMHLNYYTNIKEFEHAKSYLDKFKTQKRFLYSTDISASMIICFNYYMFSEQYGHARKIISQLKKLRKYHLTENYKFQSALMDYLTDDSPIYLRHEDLKRTDTLNYQAQIIKNLSYGNISKAHMYWKRLSQKNPSLYLDEDEFEYKGPPNLFYQCLKKAKKTLKKNPAMHLEGLSIEQKLNELFKSVNDTYLKDDLYFILYNEKVELHKDYNKLSKVISRFKKSSGKNICSSHQSYIFKDSDKKIS